MINVSIEIIIKVSTERMIKVLTFKLNSDKSIHRKNFKSTYI